MSEIRTCSCQWFRRPNPLDEIRVGTENEVGGVQNLATLIVARTVKG
ncbi:hypothetical protein [Escherichia coli]